MSFSRSVFDSILVCSRKATKKKQGEDKKSPLVENQLFPALGLKAAVPWLALSVPSPAGFLGRGFPRGGPLR